MSTPEEKIATIHCGRPEYAAALAARPGVRRQAVRAAAERLRLHLAGLDFLPANVRAKLEEGTVSDLEIVRTVAGYAAAAHRSTGALHPPDLRLELDLDRAAFHLIEPADDQEPEGTKDCAGCEFLARCERTGDAYTPPPWDPAVNYGADGCHLRCALAVAAGGDHRDCASCDGPPSNDLCPTLIAWAQAHPDAPGAAEVLALRRAEAEEYDRERAALAEEVTP